MRAVKMEMYLFDKLTVSLGQLFTAIPIVFVVVYEEAALEGTCYLHIMASILYKYVLLVLDILTATMRYLAYFLHFDPPTFDLLRQAARVYLKPGIATGSTESQALQNHVARLQDDNLQLTRKNMDLSARLMLVESRYTTLKASFSQQEQETRQCLSCVPSGDRPTRQILCSSLLKSHPLALRIDSPFHGAAQKHPDRERFPRHLLVLLLFFRCVARDSQRVVLQMASIMKASEAVHEQIMQRLVIELLTVRRAAREFHAENRMRSSLAAIVTRTQQTEMRRQKANDDRTTSTILIQMLMFRKRLSQCLEASTHRLSSVTHASSMDQHILVTELETLRLSEAQARIEKESMAKSLSDVLATLPIEMPCRTAGVGDEPVVELVLALALMWKERHRIGNAKVEQESVTSAYVRDELSRLELPTNRPIIDAPSNHFTFSGQVPPRISLSSSTAKHSSIVTYRHFPTSHEITSSTHLSVICPPQRSPMIHRGGPVPVKGLMSGTTFICTS